MYFQSRTRQNTIKTPSLIKQEQAETLSIFKHERYETPSHFKHDRAKTPSIFQHDRTDAQSICKNERAETQSIFQHLQVQTQCILGHEHGETPPEQFFRNAEKPHRLEQTTPHRDNMVADYNYETAALLPQSVRLIVVVHRAAVGESTTVACAWQGNGRRHERNTRFADPKPNNIYIYI